MLSLWIESLYQASTPTAIVILTALNCAQFGISIGLGALLSRWSAPIAPHLGIANLNDLKTSDPQKREVVLIILLNSLVAIIGWILWREGWIEIELESSWPQRCFDLMILTLMMDLVMYITHRIAHIPILYSLVHDKHHQAEHAHPLDLFYLSPIEVIGYGGIWISLLCIYTSSIEAILIYLVMNLISGTLGHLGRALPQPRSPKLIACLSYFGGPIFHGRHHSTPHANYGFYTTIWDRLFSTYDDGRGDAEASE